MFLNSCLSVLDLITHNATMDASTAADTDTNHLQVTGPKKTDIDELREFSTKRLDLLILKRNKCGTRSVAQQE